MPSPDDGLLYTDGEQPSPVDGAGSDEELMEDESDSQTALLPKEFFGSKELAVGKEWKVRIQKILEDEVQVKYVPHSDDESESSTENTVEEADDMDAEMMDNY